MSIKVAQLDFDDLAVIHASLKMALELTDHHLNDKDLPKPVKEAAKNVQKRTKVTYKKIDTIVSDMAKMENDGKKPFITEL